MSNEAEYLAKNVIQLRKVKGFSQEQLAKLSGIPRSNITYIESGDANPSLKTLLALSFGLQVSVEELLSAPRAETELFQASELTEVKRSAYTMTRLLPDKIPGLEFDKLYLSPYGQKRGTPHLKGTKEYITNIKGGVAVIVNGEVYQLEAGDVLAFPGDEPHTYKNLTAKESVNVSIVCLVRN